MGFERWWREEGVVAELRVHNIPVCISGKKPKLYLKT